MISAIKEAKIAVITIAIEIVIKLDKVNSGIIFEAATIAPLRAF